jgi:hypothetical protein
MRLARTDLQRVVPVILCIDIEPDPRLVSRGNPEPWVGYEHAQRYLDDLRPRIEARTGSPARYAWFLRMDPQISESYGDAAWVVERYRAHLEDVARLGDELGLHPHPYRWLEREGTWLHDFANQDWVEHCLRTSMEAFAASLGRPCLSMRFGDRWLNTDTVNLAERLGIRLDLTVEPGMPARSSPMPGELASGPLPDYRRVPRAPYTPSTADFRRSARGRARTIRMIPLTSGHRRLSRWWPLDLLRRWRENGLRHWRQDTPLYMSHRWSPPDTFDQMLDRALAAQRRPYLAFAIRTDLGVKPHTFESIDICLQTLLAHPAASRFVFCGPASALAVLDAEPLRTA